MPQHRIRVATALLVSSAVAMPLATLARGNSRPQPALDGTAAVCAGIDERAAGPISRETIEAVSPFYQTSRAGKQLWGATLTVRPEPGLTAERVEDAIRCRIARCTTHPASEGCPLAVRGVRAYVKSAGDRLVVILWSDYRGAGREILARARAL